MKHWNTRNLAVALAIILLSCCALVCRAEAAVLLDENFDGYDTGQPPPLPWDVTLPASDVTMNVVDTVFYEGGQSLHVLDTTSSHQGYLSRNLSSPTNSVVLVYYMMTNDASAEGAHLDLQGDGGTGWAGSFGAVSFGNAGGGGHAGWIGLVDDGGWPIPEILPYTVDTWYRVERKLNHVLDTEVIVVEEVGGPSSGPITRSGVYGTNTLISSLDIYSSGSQMANCYIDEILITPEPATLALLAVGGLGIFLRRKRRLLAALGGFVLAIVLVSQPALAGPYPQTREYMLGDIDDFNYEGPGSEDHVYVDPQYRAATENPTWPIIPFDTFQANSLVLFTFTYDLAPGELLTGATLTLGMRASQSLVTTDALKVYNITSGDITPYPFADLGWLPLPFSGTNERSVDLSNVLGDDYLPMMQANEQIDLQIADDTAVDYARLIIEVIPEPATLALLAAGLGALLVRKRRS